MTNFTVLHTYIKELEDLDDIYDINHKIDIDNEQDMDELEYLEYSKYSEYSEYSYKTKEKESICKCKCDPYYTFYLFGSSVVIITLIYYLFNIIYVTIEYKYKNR